MDKYWYEMDVLKTNNRKLVNVVKIPGREERLKNAFQTGERMKTRSARVQNAFPYIRPFGTRS